jgi:hypothetical protein
MVLFIPCFCDTLGAAYMSIFAWIDVPVAHFFLAIRNEHFVSFFSVITLFGEAKIILVLALVLSAILWYRQKRLLAGGILLALFVSEALTYVGKILVHRERPSFPAHTLPRLLRFMDFLRISCFIRRKHEICVCSLWLVSYFL